MILHTDITVYDCWRLMCQFMIIFVEFRRCNSNEGTQRNVQQFYRECDEPYAKRLSNIFALRT